MGQAGLRESANLVETSRIGDGDRLAAIGDRNFGATARETVKEATPVTPGGSPWRIGRIFHQRADALEALQMLGVLPEGESHLALLEDGVESPQACGGGVGHGGQSAQGRVEMSQRFGIGPAPV